MATRRCKGLSSIALSLVGRIGFFSLYVLFCIEDGPQPIRSLIIHVNARPSLRQPQQLSDQSHKAERIIILVRCCIALAQLKKILA